MKLSLIREFKLTPMQVAIITTMHTVGESAARDIARLTNYSERAIYLQLNKLYDYGLIDFGYRDDNAKRKIWFAHENTK